MQQIRWHIGCSGFHYKEWRDFFYPQGLAASKWFDYYTTQFNTLELNTSFYRFPTLSALEFWYKKAPEGFSFSAKMPRSITHFKKFEDTERMVNDFYTVLSAGLQEKLDCVLIQLPPQLKYSEEKLEKIITQADDRFKNVIEFRHESWWRNDVKQILAERNITFCGVSFPKIQYDEAEINTGVVYYRFHGVPQLFYSSYAPSFIESVFNQIRNHPVTSEAFIYFNNTASSAAVENARVLQDLVSVA
jgi:uncharacterized protein YecE (DUF72 family)